MLVRRVASACHTARRTPPGARPLPGWDRGARLQLLRSHACSARLPRLPRLPAQPACPALATLPARTARLHMTARARGTRAP